MTDTQTPTLAEVRLIGTSRLRRKLTNCRKLLAALQQAPDPDKARSELCHQIDAVIRALETELDRRERHSIARAVL